jgi:hypothetical protein
MLLSQFELRRFLSVLCRFPLRPLRIKVLYGGGKNQYITAKDAKVAQRALRAAEDC